MKFKFDTRAVKLLMPLCFKGDVDAMQRGIGPILAQRADPAGKTYAKVAGARIDLQLLGRTDERGEFYILVTIPEAVVDSGDLEGLSRIEWSRIQFAKDQFMEGLSYLDSFAVNFRGEFVHGEFQTSWYISAPKVLNTSDCPTWARRPRGDR